MTLRLGFVGVGRWARKLAESFRACGAEVVAHDRKMGAPPPPYGVVRAADFHKYAELAGFGSYMPWRDQLADKSIDAIIAVAPPEITTEVAMACAAAGRAVLATKPLLRHPETITNVFAVDFWRIWSQAHAWYREDKNVTVELHGSGPFRDFPGALDYGPHVMAAALDYRFTEIIEAQRLPSAQGELFEALLGDGDRRMRVKFGNGSDKAVRRIGSRVEIGHWIGQETKSSVLEEFARSFCQDVHEGFPDTKLLNYSREGMRLLKRIREEAK